MQCLKRICVLPSYILLTSKTKFFFPSSLFRPEAPRPWPVQDVVDDGASAEGVEGERGRGGRHAEGGRGGAEPELPEDALHGGLGREALKVSQADIF